MGKSLQPRFVVSLIQPFVKRQERVTVARKIAAFALVRSGKIDGVFVL